MAMFGSRPEEPTVWAGLPSEPLEEDEFTTLHPTTSAAPGGDLFGFTAPESLTISLTAIPIPPRADSDE